MLAYLVASGITTGSLYALIALGVVVLYKAAGVVNFSHGEQIMLGGYFAYSFYLLAHLGYVPAALLAVMGTAAIGLLTFYVGFRPLIGQGMMSVLLATLGLSGAGRVTTWHSHLCFRRNRSISESSRCCRSSSSFLQPAA
jgi:branched-chain amino acid transport system permease protein